MVFRRSGQDSRRGWRVVCCMVVMSGLLMLSGGCTPRHSALLLAEPMPAQTQPDPLLPVESAGLSSDADTSPVAPSSAIATGAETATPPEYAVLLAREALPFPSLHADFETLLADVARASRMLREFEPSGAFTGLWTPSMRPGRFSEVLTPHAGSEQDRLELEDAGEVPSIADVVLREYENWEGVCYRTGGCDDRGVDCSGLTQAIFRDAFQIDLPHSSVAQSKMGEAVSKRDIQPGDLVYFIDRGRNHIGVAISEKEFVHSSRRGGVVVSKFDKYWSARLIRVRRILPENG